MNRQMRWRTVILLLLLALPTLRLSVAAAQEQSSFDRFFETRTMRVDYYHTGNAAQEIISLERVVSDGAWAGSRVRLIDDLQLGKYFFEVIDPESGQVIYSRGFCSIYGEWETTGEARVMHRTFHESLRFPWPRTPVRIVLKKRGEWNVFEEIWSFELDPSARWVNSADAPPQGKVWTVFESGPPSAKVDIVLLGEGYTEDELPKFHADAKRLTDELFSVEPFRSRRSDFNVRAIDHPTAESGISRPHAGRYRRNPVGTQYSIFDLERYMLTYDNRTLRDVLAAAPYDFVAILVNEKQYGGGGIYNFHMTAAVDSDFSDYVFVHEFGHHFAGLADEYYTSDVAYETGGEVHPEPWEPNVTALHDSERLKWRDLVEPGTPIPTPWDKEAFEEHGREIRRQRQELIERRATEAELDEFFQQQRESEMRMLVANRYAGKVGAFEGAMYETVGLYRPEIDCIMFSRNRVEFCRVCRRAIERIIDLYTGK